MRRNDGMRKLAALFCACLLLAAGAALAEPVELNAQMGYGGTVTYLRKLPVTVEVTNSGADAAGTLTLDIDRSEAQYDRYSMPLTVAAGATVRVTLPVTLTMKQAEYRVKWMVDGQEAGGCQVIPAAVLDPACLTVGVLSDDPQKLTYLNISQRSDPLKRGEYWQTVPLSLESFPADNEGARFFDLLVVDGIDLSALSGEQQAALDGWLRGGGVLLLGGGAQAVTGFPYFEKYTGISAGALSSGEGLSQKLLDLFRLSEAPLEEAVSLVELTGAKGRAVGEDPLLDVARVDSGYVFTAAFSLSERPLSTWLGKNAIWQRMLLQYAQARYQSTVEARQYGSSNNMYVDSGITQGITVPNQGATVAPVLILAVFLALMGFGSYFLLKRWDKTEWMWVTVPGLAVVCSLLIWATSGMLGLQKPVAVSYTIVNIGKDGSTSSFTGVGVAKANRERTVVRLDNGGAIDMDQENGYYYESEYNTGTAVKKMRYEYELGALPSVTFTDTRQSWESTYFVVRDAPIGDVAVSGQAGWEGENLVFTIENTGSLPLSDGLVMTNYGFVTVPALLPGQTITAQMTPNQKNITDSSSVKDGMLLNETERRLCSLYDYINAYGRGKKEEKGDEITLRCSILSACANQANWYTAQGMSDPQYFAFSDGLAQVELSLNGERVTRKAQRDAVSVTLAMSPVSADGTVRFLSGSIPASPAELDSQGKPQLVETSNRQSRYASYRLADSPVFAFDMSQMPESWTLEHFDIAGRYYYYSYEVKLYRVRDGSWVSVKKFEYDQSSGREKVSATLPQLSEFVDGDGMLYAQFTENGKTVDYAEIDLPMLTMDGRLK